MDQFRENLALAKDFGLESKNAIEFEEKRIAEEKEKLKEKKHGGSMMLRGKTHRQKRKKGRKKDSFN